MTLDYWNDGGWFLGWTGRQYASGPFASIADAIANTDPTAISGFSQLIVTHQALVYGSQEMTDMLGRQVYKVRDGHGVSVYHPYTEGLWIPVAAETTTPAWKYKTGRYVSTAGGFRETIYITLAGSFGRYLLRRGGSRKTWEAGEAELDELKLEQAGE